MKDVVCELIMDKATRNKKQETRNKKQETRNKKQIILKNITIKI